jgi:hydroxyacylglutathione hydrolase/adenylyltransferase/sulfurtransferase
MSAFEQTDRDLDPAQVKEKLDAGEVQLVDVREPYEWEAGRIAGALHIELEHLAARSGEIDKDKPVVFQCRVGRRSAMATAAFGASGYDAYNMAGGITAWTEKGLPLEPEGGQVADHATGPDRAHP